MTKTKALRNNSIDLFRYIAALLIVVIHARPLIGYGEFANMLTVEFIPRIGVPFFFIVSGYFYAKKLYADKKPFRSYLSKLILIYTMWSVIYAVKLIKFQIEIGEFGRNSLFEIIKGYFFTGISEHLWFCPSLIYSICFITLLHKVRLDKIILPLSMTLFVIGCCGYAYYHILGEHLPLLNVFYQSEQFTVLQRLLLFGPSFVLLGGAVCRSEDRLKGKPKRFWVIITVVLFALYIGEKALLMHLDTGRSYLFTLLLYPFIFSLLVTLLQCPLPKCTTAAKYARNAATFTYYSHIIFITMIGNFVSDHLILYLLVCAAATVISAVITKIDNKYLNYLNM